MSTAANIAFEHKDGSVTVTYIHFDGYEDNVGAKLYCDYNSANKAERLAYIGYADSLEDTLNETIIDRTNDTPPKKFSSFTSYIASEDFNGAQFLYVWRTGKQTEKCMKNMWMVCNVALIRFQPFGQVSHCLGESADSYFESVGLALGIR